MDAAKTLQGTPYCDCLVIFDPESDRSVEMAGVWSEAARNLGAIPVCRPLEDLEAGELAGNRLSAGGCLSDALILSEIRGYSAPTLDLLLNFVIFGGAIAASGPRLSGSSAIRNAEGRNSFTVRSEIARVEQYTSRADPWDEINADLLQKGIPSLRMRRPGFFSETAITRVEKGVSLDLSSGREVWQIELSPDEPGWDGILRLPFPAKSIRALTEETLELGSAIGPVLMAKITRPAVIEVTAADTPERFPAASEEGWWVKRGEEPDALLSASQDWDSSAGEGPLLYSTEADRSDFPPVPEGGTLMLDLGNSAGQLALALNGKLLQPAQGSDGTIFPVNPKDIQDKNQVRIAVKRTKEDAGTEDHTVGIFSLPDWQVSEAGQMTAFTI